LGAVPAYWPADAHYERTQRVLTEKELRELPEDLITIGSHTVTHPFLPSLEQPDAWRELHDSRTTLEQLLKRRVTLFSFPFGGFNSNLLTWAHEAGYDRVFSTLPVSAFATPDEAVIGRVTAEPYDTPLEFRLKLLGAYRWLPYAFVLKRFLLSTFLMKRWRRQPHYVVNRFEKKPL
jgi:peptidoglycan/xylan/chitin deacetylase (PgdA/CDA1 family)